MYGYGLGGSGFGIAGLISELFWIVILVDLILLGVWLWKKIGKE